MGAVLAKFRKDKTTIEVLEKLDEEIKEIQEYTISTQARQKRYVGNFLVISIGLYILCFIVFYFAFFPPTWLERITYSIPLLVFPLFIFLLKHLVAWFFQRNLNKKSVKLSKLKSEKKKVLEKVMDKETYKVALDILNRFGDKSNGLKPAPIYPTIELTTPSKLAMQTTPKSQPRSNQVLTQRITPTNQQQRVVVSPSGQLGMLTYSTPTAITSSTPFSRLQNIQQRASPVPMQSQQFRRRTPFPIINHQNKGVLDKFVDYLIGDGIQNRFAMICKECYSHNGMGLQEEYEYTSFRCVYCNAMNPSKKSRPVGPKLPIMTTPHINSSEVSGVALQRSNSTESVKNSSSEKNSDTEDDKVDLQKEETKEIINNEMDFVELPKKGGIISSNVEENNIEEEQQSIEENNVEEEQQPVLENKDKDEKIEEIINETEIEKE